MATIAPPGHHVILHGRSWDFYERLLAELGHSPGVRVTFDQGTLEILVRFAEHEWPNRMLAELVSLAAAESGVDLLPLGSATIKRKRLQRGFEPDSSFYLQHAPLMRTKRKVDFEVDPAPELVIEVDVTCGLLDRLPVLAAMGVPEVWRLRGDEIAFFALEGGGYRLIDCSLAVPVLTPSAAGHFLASATLMAAPEWTRQVRAWVRTQTGA